MPTQLAQLIDPCLKCTLCNTYCPVRRVDLTFPGPKVLGPELARWQAWQNRQAQAVSSCTGCKICELACPAGVKPAELILRAKYSIKKSPRIALRDWLLAHPDRLGSFALSMSPLVNRVLSAPIVATLLSHAGIVRPDLLRYSNKPLQTGVGTSETQIESLTGKHGVVVFAGCFTNYNRPEVGIALREVLKHNEIRAEFPKLACCGLPAEANGMKNSTVKYARANIKKLNGYINRGYDIITPCPSCSLALKQAYPRLLPGMDTERIAARTYECGEYLMQLKNRGSLDLSLKGQAQKFIYHTPCHLRAQGISEGFPDLIAEIPKLEIRVLPELCCGMSGTYGFKAERLQTSLAIGKELFLNLKAAGAYTVLTECGTCLLQIKHGSGRNVVHPIEILAAAYRQEGKIE